MNKLRGRIMAALLIIASCLLPGSEAECDLEDCELDLEIEDFFSGCCGHHDDCDDCDDWYFDFWWDD